MLMESGITTTVCLPTIPNHADTFGFCLAVKFGALHKIFLAAYALGIAKACFGQSVGISPCYFN
jgi:hypothetical protein